MKHKKLIIYFAVVITVSVLCSCLYFSGLLTWAENKTYDSRIKQTSGYFKPSDSIVVVLLDQESLDWAQEEFGWGWPWPRESYGRMVKFFNACNANSVAFDMVYTEPSVYGPQDDEYFASAAADFGRVVQTVFYQTHNPDETPLLPVENLKNSAGIIGTVQSFLDDDGVARRNRLYSTSVYKEPSLSIASLAVSNTLPDVAAIPKAKNGGMYIRFQSDLYRFAPYNAKTILQAQMALEQGLDCGFNLEDFEGCYVFFGLDAPGLFDICSTPVSAAYQGVGVHICQLDTILNQSYLWDIPFFLIAVIILLCSAFGALMGNYSVNGKFTRFAVHFAALLGFMAAYVFLSYFLFIQGPVFPVITPLLAAFLSFALCLLRNYITEGRKRRFLKHAFGQYLSPKVIDKLIEHPETLKLGGEKREISVYFSDVQGFTSISEKLDPQELTSLLNTYLSAMTNIILAHGGTIDKYEGDAIIAFWNAPAYEEDHAKRALEAAIECQKKLEEMRPVLMKMCGKQMYQRIGLNTGYAVVGNMGSDHRFDYTMLGDTVNLASRLEGINKLFGTYTMCSKATMEKAREYGCNFAFRPLADIAVVGKTEGVQVFEPMLHSEYDSRKSDFDSFAAALNLFTKGDFAEAKILFQKTAATDPAAANYVQICDRHIKNPPENWNGVLRATEK